jgi:hypothetical protein
MNSVATRCMGVRRGVWGISCPTWQILSKLVTLFWQIACYTPWKIYPPLELRLGTGVLHILLMVMLFLLLAFGVTKLEYRKSENVKDVALNKILHLIIRVFSLMSCNNVKVMKSIS